MQYVVFARDRRRKKSRLKGLIFFMAVVSTFIGILLALKSQSVASASSEEYHYVLNEVKSEKTKSGILDLAAVINSASKEALQDDQKQIEQQATDGIVDESATSYDDELSAVDDEAEERIAGSELSQEAEDALADFLDAADQALRIKDQFSHTVVRGDKLKDVLELSGLEADVAKALIKQYPALATLKAEQQFYWTLNEKGELDYLDWLVSEKEEQVFQRTENGKFSRQVIEKKGVWQQDVLKGTIDGTFSASLKKLGLSQRQINQLNSGLQWQIATNKLKKGDKFAILIKREYVNGKVTELGNVEAIHIVSGKKSYYAIQAENGGYYNRHGETIGKGFARHPLSYAARVSSHFNLRRFHPVTKRIAPHKGVDFALPIGTPIIAPADGVVEHVAYQANGAGRYIKLSHGREYSTVYMHLSKTLVKPGQSVKKGDRIALSGNTGRSTGPHLHYEFHINGRPVNPMTVKLPGSGSAMPEKERKTFLQKAKSIEAKLKL